MAKNKKGNDDFAKFSRDVEDQITALPEGGEAVIAEVTDGGEEKTTDSVPTAVEGTVSSQEVAEESGRCCATFHTGRELPKVSPREGVDPLLVEAYKTLRTLVAGGLITPWAGMVLGEVDRLLVRLKQKIED